MQNNLVTKVRYTVELGGPESESILLEGGWVDGWVNGIVQSWQN